MKPLRHGDLTNYVELRGRRPPADVLSRAIRDHLLRLAAERHCRGMSDREAAETLRTKLGRYRECAWQRDRICEACPDRHRGKLNELFWQVLSCSRWLRIDPSVSGGVASAPPDCSDGAELSPILWAHGVVFARVSRVPDFHVAPVDERGVCGSRLGSNPRTWCNFGIGGGKTCRSGSGAGVVTAAGGLGWSCSTSH